MNKLYLILTILLLTGCSHNPAIMTIGRQIRLGTAEYGDLTYLNGFAIIDCSRENSEWEIEIDDSDGISFDPTTKTLKGVKKIRRRIGKQVTGYLKDINKTNPEAVNDYLKADIMFVVPEKKEVKKEEDYAIIKAVVSETIKALNQKK